MYKYNLNYLITKLAQFTDDKVEKQKKVIRFFNY